MIPQFKVSITHSAVTTDYINETFTNVNVTGRENGVSSAILIADNRHNILYPDQINRFDTIQIFSKKASETVYTEIFDGTIREVNPSLSITGNILTLKCKGLGEAEEETHCSTNYGYTSQNDSISTVEDIIEDLVDNYINKSYGSANVTGYAITKTYIPTIDAGLSIPFINAPYQTNKTLIDILCLLDTAYRDGATAGPHYFTDVLGNLRIKTIGTQQVDGGGGGGDWGIYCGGSNIAINLYQGIDFTEYSLNVPTDEYANNVVLVANMRKPSYDYWTEDSGGAALWGNDALTAITDENGAGNFVVGSHSLKFDPNGAVQGYGYYPSTADANWDTSKWGSIKSIPTLNFYCMKHNLTTATTRIYLSTNDTARKTDYFSTTFMNWQTEADDKWYHKSIPIGPYWKTVVETRGLRWAVGLGTPLWTNIDSIEFAIAGGGDAGALWIDDLHFSGKIIREAVDTTEVTAYKERQHPILSKVALDDSCIASDDTGLAGAIAYGELLRRVNIPRTITFSIALRPELKPGEYFKIYAGKTYTSYTINGVDFRVLQYTHILNVGGGSTIVTATDDVKNSFPISKVDVRNVLNEYLLENNDKAVNMQGGEVDLLIEHLRKTY